MQVKPSFDEGKKIQLGLQPVAVENSPNRILQRDYRAGSNSTTEPFKNDIAQLKKNNKHDLSDIHILIADKDETDKHIFLDAIQHAGYACRTAETGMETLNVLKKSEIDVVIVGITLTDMSGMELTRLIKQTCGADVIVVKDYNERCAYETVIDEGASDLIENPVSIPELIAKLKRILRERAISKKHKEVEAALQKSEKKCLTLMNSLPQVVFETNKSGKLTFINKNALDLLGYTQSEFHKDFKVVNMFIAEERDEFEKNFKLARKGKTPGGNEYTAQRKDGSTFPVVTQCYPILHDNKPVGVRGIIIAMIDYSKIKEEKNRLERQLIQAQKMEAIGSLAGGIAHDFNNTLGVILGYTELAMLDLPKENPIYRNLENVCKGCMRAKDLIKQILSFSRQSELKTAPLRIDSLVKESAKMLRASIPTTIEIRQNIPSEPIIANTNSTQINQVLLNLCTNAAHAMKESGGRLEIGLVKVSLNEDDVINYTDLTPGNYVKLTVRDTGSGIEPYVIDRIFDPYFTTKAVNEGTGMGLAMVQRIVKSHGGEIKVRSEIGRGTIFNVFLPIVESEYVKEIIAHKTFPRGNENILFVDDEESIANIGKNILEYLGYEVTAEKNPERALEVFNKKPEKFELVITDMTMPKMTGVMLSEKILKIRPDIPIILCTGYNDQIDEKKAKSMGIHNYILKPLIMHDLANTVRNAIDKK